MDGLRILWAGIYDVLTKLDHKLQTQQVLDLDSDLEPPMLSD